MFGRDTMTPVRATSDDLAWHSCVLKVSCKHAVVIIATQVLVLDMLFALLETSNDLFSQILGFALIALQMRMVRL